MGADGRRHPVYLAYRGGAAVAKALPEWFVTGAAERVGVLVGRIAKTQRARVRRNLGRVVSASELDATIDAAYRSYARYWAETLRMPKPGLDDLRRRTTVEGLERLEERTAGGRGVVFVTAHVGNWDLAGAWLASAGYRVLAIAEELRPRSLFELFVELRRAVGVEVHPLGKGASVRALVSGLQQGAALGLVADRDITGTGDWVEFCGEKTLLPTGPAVLAMRTGAVIVPGALYQRPGGRFHGKLLEPIEAPDGRASAEEARALTQQVAYALEELIRAEPGQWHLFQPNWPSDPGYHTPRPD